MRPLFALSLVVLSMVSVRDGKAEPASDSLYPTVAAALEGLRAKPGIKTSVQSGWIVFEDRSTLSLWSFAPSGHPAYPAAIHRKVVQEGDKLLIKTEVLCEAPKPACEGVVADFEKLNEKVREDLRH